LHLPAADKYSDRVWGLYERWVEAQLEKKYKPVPLPKVPQYSSQDVSIVVATIDTPATLPKSLSQWLDNNPREIIFVTIQRDLGLVQSLVSNVPQAACITRVVTCDVTNKREQLAKGIRMARGEIVALVDDDVFWPVSTVLPYLLAGFEDPSVGGVQGKQRYAERSFFFVFVCVHRYMKRPMADPVSTSDQSLHPGG
jgi:hypothetical protein